MQTVFVVSDEYLQVLTIDFWGFSRASVIFNVLCGFICVRSLWGSISVCTVYKCLKRINIQIFTRVSNSDSCVIYMFSTRRG